MPRNPSPSLKTPPRELPKKFHLELLRGNVAFPRGFQGWFHHKFPWVIIPWDFLRANVALSRGFQGDSPTIIPWDNIPWDNIPWEVLRGNVTISRGFQGEMGKNPLG
jgi:hypothetical protein